MERRAFLLWAGGASVASVAGCLGGDPDDSSPGTSDPPDHDDEIDPNAEYVVLGPEGYFSARGPLNTDLEQVAIHGYDLVAYFEEERAVSGSDRYEFGYNGATFRFASDAHRETFADDPEAYLPEFGGYCSLGVGNAYKDGMHPEAFDILDGNLYFNLTPGIHEAWLRNYEVRIETAEAHWPEIRHSTDPVNIGPGIGSSTE